MTDAPAHHRQYPGQLVRLRPWRKRQRLTQRALAVEAGLTQAAVSQLERGLRIPTLRTVERLAVALGIEPPRLLEGPVPASLSREAIDRIARYIVRGTGALTREEQRLARDIGALCIQKLRAHRAAGGQRYARMRWDVAHRPAWLTAAYGPQIVQQVLHRTDLLLAMGAWS